MLLKERKWKWASIKVFVSIVDSSCCIVQQWEKQLSIDKCFLFPRTILFHQTQWRMMGEVIKHLSKTNTNRGLCKVQLCMFLCLFLIYLSFDLWISFSIKTELWPTVIFLWVNIIRVFHIMYTSDQTLYPSGSL